MGDEIVILWSRELKSDFFPGKKKRQTVSVWGKKKLENREREKDNNRERRTRRIKRKVSKRTLDPFEKTLSLSFLFRRRLNKRVVMPKICRVFLVQKRV
jgi:hypothetical protein